MPSFDISSEMNWQELDNAINQTLKESLSRYDFKGVKVELKLDQKAKTLTFWVSEEAKFDAVKDMFFSKAIKRGLSLFAFDFQAKESAFGGSVRVVAKVQAGIDKDKAKTVVAAIKDSKLKVQAQIQDEQVRVTGKSRDDLQSAIALLRTKEEELKLAMQYGNFRD